MKATHINHVQIIIQHQVFANSELPDFTRQILALLARLYLLVPGLVRRGGLPVRRLQTPHGQHDRQDIFVSPLARLRHCALRLLHVAALGLPHTQLDGRS